MAGVRRKRFDENLFDRYNSVAIDAVLTYIDGLGQYACVNPDMYGPDIITYHHGFTPSHFIEVEVKTLWKADMDEFPFPSVQIPERKLKFAGLNLSCEFWILREDCQMAMVIPNYLLQIRKPVEVPNRYMSSGEYFFQIPVDCVEIIDMRSDICETQIGEDGAHGVSGGNTLSVELEREDEGEEQG